MAMFKLLQRATCTNFQRKSLLHTTAVKHKTQSGRYRITPKKDFPLTYEMANPPHCIAHRKSWNSWNTCNYLKQTISLVFVTYFCS